ncbi:MAG: hypothetical protein APF81_03075 [Desulfosporosinus sp. BRH_c37]|nr:MAG: hypothetical protein APF81_03075 [Desulfosporosinus sp. BRH_c37]
MENKKKKGFFEMLIGSKKDKKGSCCGGFELEEVSEEKPDNKGSYDPNDPNDPSASDKDPRSIN